MLGGGQVGYRFTPDRTHARAKEFIASSYADILLVEMWQGWQTLPQQKGGCNAHARRPFAKILQRKIGSSDGY